MHGTHGIVLGIGVIGRVGGTLTHVGHMTGIGIIAMLTITAIITALSVTDTNSTAVIMIYTRVYPV